MKGLLVQQVGEGLLVVVHPVEVGSMVKQGLDDCRLGGLVQGGGVQSRVPLAVHRVRVGPALQQEADGWHGGEDADRVAAHLHH